MKKNLYKICGVLLLGVVMLVINACKEELYSIDNSYYDGVEISLKNILVKGLDGAPDTLMLEQDNVEQIMIESETNPEIIFAPEAFIYRISKNGEMNNEVIEVSDDGSITPLSRDTVLLDITFRANKTLAIPLVVVVYKEYRAVEGIQVSSNLLIEVDLPGAERIYNLNDMLLVLPLNADNKELIFSIDAENSKQYAEIVNGDSIRGIKDSGRNSVVVNVVSVDNPEVTATLRIKVTDEILITKVLTTPGLDGVEIGVGTSIDLNVCTSVLPLTVHPDNAKLTFEIVEGAGVLSVNEEGVITAMTPGVAKVKAVSKNNMFVEFTINVKEGLTDLLRLFWTANTSGFETTDNTNGAPELMFDEKATTYAVFVKPGKKYNDVSTPAEHIPYFTVDMKTVQKFNYIRWNHRSGHSEVGLRVHGIKIYGSNTGAEGEFTEITKDGKVVPEGEESENIMLDTSITAKQEIAIPESEYRYVRIMLTKWSDNTLDEEGKPITETGSTMQIGEFGLGYKQ